METLWSGYQAHGIEVEERELSQKEFELLFCNESEDVTGDN